MASFRVGQWIVSPDLNSIQRKDEPAKQLEHKVMQVLVGLVREPGTVRSKQSLIDEVWPDTHVSEDALFRCIRELRRAFEDDPKAPVILQTIPKKGYRLIAEVSELPGKDRLSRDAASSGSKRVSSKVLGAAAALTVLFLVVAWLRPVPGTANPISSIAVLPFLDMSPDGGLDYLALGLADSVAFSLSRSDDLRVVSSTSSLRFRQQEVEPTLVAAELRVRALLMGKVVSTGDGISVSAELVDGRLDKLIWGRNYTIASDQVLQLQKQIAQDVVANLGMQVDIEQLGLSRYQAASTDAYHQYLRGRYHWSKTTEQGFRESVKYFQKALDHAPDYALAYSGLADAYSMLGFYNILSPDEAFPKARAAALRALELNDTLAEAHTSLAGILQNYDQDWDAAGAQYKKALLLNPDYATAHHWYGLFYLAPHGRFDEALRRLRRAEELTPLSLRVSTALGFVSWLSGDAESAVQQHRKTLEVESNYPPALHYLALALADAGQSPDALASAERAVSASGRAPYTLSGLAYVKAQGGNLAGARTLLEELKALTATTYVPAYEIAAVELALGNRESALEWLTKEAEARGFNLTFAPVDPRFESLRSDPDFQGILRRIGLAGSDS